MSPRRDSTLAALQRELAEARAERDEAFVQQAAVAEVLGVINSSPGDLAPVFDAILEKAHNLCGAEFGGLLTYDGEFVRLAAQRNLPSAWADIVRGPWLPRHDHPVARIMRGERLFQIDDMSKIAQTSDDPVVRAAVELGGIRTLLLVPLRKDGAFHGYITAFRQEVRLFTDKQIALLESFAAQAVIAMENARLITETREALEQQTATAEVLGVINSSPGDLAPVFEAILERAHTLCGAAFGTLFLRDGDDFRGVAMRGLPPPFAERMRQGIRDTDAPISKPLLDGERYVHILDVAAVDHPIARLATQHETHTVLSIPLRRDDALLGLIVAARAEVRLFSDREIALVENFAAQAVIAMENARLITETREALERQTATSEVLETISSSPGRLEPVFEAVLANAVRICGGTFGLLALCDGDGFIGVAAAGLSRELSDNLSRLRHPPPGTGLHRLQETSQTVQVADCAADPAYDAVRAQNPLMAAVRTALHVPMLKEGALLGAIMIYRDQVAAFADKEVELVEGFAKQAVIAIENARLIAETQEALEQQTATAEVLGVINSSPGDLTPVWDTMLEKAVRLCAAETAHLLRYDGVAFSRTASLGIEPEFDKLLPVNIPLPHAITKDSVPYRLLSTRATIHVHDLRDDESVRAGAPAETAAVEQHGARTVLFVPLLREGEVVGCFVLHRLVVRPFSDKQIALVQNFAAQAVIAMENARLITETREALEQQTATAEVLGVINASPGDLAPVFDAVVENALRLCEATHGHLHIYDGERIHSEALRGDPHFVEWQRGRGSHAITPGSPTERALHGERVVHIADAVQSEAYQSSPAFKELIDHAGIRTGVTVALRKDATFLGTLNVYRQEVRPFSEKQIALLQNFAAQAVIAMENARLITETRQRTAELQESLEFQTATSDVLQIISRSTFDLQPVLDTLVATAKRLCNADMAIIYRRLGDAYRLAANLGFPPEYEAFARTLSLAPSRASVTQRAALERRISHVADIAADPEYELPEASELGSARTALGVPLLREGEPVGVFTLARQRVEPFSEKEIALVSTFADQAVIAMENARLITETREARDDAQAALRDLKAAQANLVQAEKMASLGQLTAGIAHEIKNPLNFVNNFASLSTELLDELKADVTPALASLDGGKRETIDETIEMLTGNLDKIVEHGQRADNIVKSMLEHSRGVSGERRVVDLNNLIEEALNLAYHGARAQDQGFNITLERDYATALAPIELAPQEMTRVFLNLFGNGFYAADKRARGDRDMGYRPTLAVTTREQEEGVEVRVRDNGAGIPPEIRDKLFQPFFTTKPTGEGTGLGLSISYDIVTQQHGGTITVESEPGSYTEFTVRLPRQ